MFSPYYARAIARGRGDPINHGALNVALYEPRGGHWTMTERARAAIAQSPERLTIGPSAIGYEDGVLRVRIDETTVPLPRRVRGEIRLIPGGMTGRHFALDPAGRHHWYPIAPFSRIEVALERPGIHWSGQAYFDANAGAEPLARAFRAWDWCRSHEPAGTRIFYDVVTADGLARPGLALAIAPDGAVRALDDPPPLQDLRRGLWGVGGRARADAPPRITRRLEDTPFYTRSLIEASLAGDNVAFVHESLDLVRFTSVWVPWLLPFRMPRL